jgi:REP element-mobilizing transposase RayT
MKYLDGHYYHIYNRGAHKKEIFFEPANYMYRISLFNKYLHRYEVSVVAYCLMPNHYHLIGRQNGHGDIGGFLRPTFNACTQAINKRYGHSGTLFQGQSKSKHIDSGEVRAFCG